MGGAVLVLAAVAVLAIPLLVLATALVAYPLSFLVQMMNVDAGFRLATAYTDMVRQAFSPAALPTLIPRLVTLCLASALIVLAVLRPGSGRTSRSRQRATATAADGGRGSSARRGAPSRGCGIFARRYGSSFEAHTRRRSRGAAS